jgi:hypothetical protein
MKYFIQEDSMESQISTRELRRYYREAKHLRRATNAILPVENHSDAIFIFVVQRLLNKLARQGGSGIIW